MTALVARLGRAARTPDPALLALLLIFAALAIFLPGQAKASHGLR